MFVGCVLVCVCVYAQLPFGQQAGLQRVQQCITPVQLL